MIKFFFTLFIIIAICLDGCAPSIENTNSCSSDSSQLMPNWFWRTNISGGSRLAVGYAPQYFNLATSYDEAFKDAALRLFIDRNCRVTGGRGSISDGSVVFSIGSNMHIIVDTSGFANYQAQLVRIDSVSSSMGIVAMLVGEKYIKVNKHLFPPPPVSDIQSTSKTNALNGLGSACFYYQMTSSWREAENVARLEAALATSIRFRDIKLAENAASIEAILLEVDVQLYNIRTVARTIDFNNKIVWVKVEAEHKK